MKRANQRRFRMHNKDKETCHKYGHDDIHFVETRLPCKDKTKSMFKETEVVTQLKETTLFSPNGRAPKFYIMSERPHF